MPDFLELLRVDVERPPFPRAKPRRLSEEAAKARHLKARKTAGQNAHVEWKLICDKGDCQIYHLRSEGVLKYDRPKFEGNEYYDVQVKPDRVKFVHIIKSGANSLKWYTTLRFVGGKMRCYQVHARNRKMESVRGLNFQSVGKRVRDFRSAVSGVLSNREESYQRLTTELAARIQTLIAEAAARQNVKYDPTLSVETNYLKINRPAFYFAWPRPIIGAYMTTVAAMFKATDRQSVKHICGSNTKLVTRLFYTSAQKDEELLFISKCVYSHLVRRFWPVDYMQKLWAAGRLCYPIVEKQWQTKVGKYREVLKRMQPATLFAYLTSEATRANELRDTVQMLARAPAFVLPERIRSIKELHDQLVPATRNYDHGEFELKCPKRVEKVDGLKFGDYEIVAPKSSTEMVAWGNELRNCVGQYAWRVRDRSTIILGVKEKGMIKYGLELSAGLNVEQFRGKFNAEPEVAERDFILGQLNEVIGPLTLTTTTVAMVEDIHLEAAVV